MPSMDNSHMISTHGVNIREDRSHIPQFLKTLEVALILGTPIFKFNYEILFFYNSCDFAYAFAIGCHSCLDETFFAT